MGLNALFVTYKQSRQRALPPIRTSPCPERFSRQQPHLLSQAVASNGLLA